MINFIFSLSKIYHLQECIIFPIKIFFYIKFIFGSDKLLIYINSYGFNE